MRSKSFVLPLFLMIFALFATSTTVHAQSIKARMAARLPTINAMKNQGIVGENSHGFLVYRSANKPHQDVVAAENRDRRTVYQEIAKKEGVSPALVGQRRARMLADIGAKGQWFQLPDGKWHKK